MIKLAPFAYRVHQDALRLGKYHVHVSLQILKVGRYEITMATNSQRDT